MPIKKHVFISENGEMLPRWKQAFPNAVALTFTQLSALSVVDFIWLRLQAGLPVEQQIQTVRAHEQSAAVIILSDIPNDDEATAAFFQAARGYANSHAFAATLKQIARVVEQGGLWIGESLMRRLLVGMNRLPQPTSAVPHNPHKLTHREMEVAKAIAAGASNKEVARQLNITERTVKAHVSGLFTKLAVSDRLQLALKIREISRPEK